MFLKSLELFFHTLWRTFLNLAPAWPADVCAAKIYKQIFKNKLHKGYERIIRRFEEDLAT